MLQIDKKSIYIKKGHSTGRHVILSYDTPIMIIHDSMIITSNKKYGTTTSKHKTYIINTLYKGFKVVNIPHKTFKDIITSEGLSLGIA